MGKRQRYGECRLCGEYRALTFEHVPPKCAFNDKAARRIDNQEIIKSFTENRLPWDFSNLRTKTYQKGRGGYYLCSDCNSKTGSWYVPFFEDFVRGIYDVVSSGDIILSEKRVNMRLESIRPLPVIKEIMVMFCDINLGCFNDQNLKSFLLEKENESSFDSKKYRLYCHLAKGPLFRMNSVSTNVLNATSSNPVVVTLSEIISVPLGFTLYIDLPDGYKPEGFEITEFSKYHYEDTASCALTLPLLESNTAFSGDYRSKEIIVPKT